MAACGGHHAAHADRVLPGAAAGQGALRPHHPPSPARQAPQDEETAVAAESLSQVRDQELIRVSIHMSGGWHSSFLRGFWAIGVDMGWLELGLHHAEEVRKHWQASPAGLAAIVMRVPRGSGSDNADDSLVTEGYCHPFQLLSKSAIWQAGGIITFTSAYIAHRAERSPEFVNCDSQSAPMQSLPNEGPVCIF